jgi:hypothetical protein
VSLEIPLLNALTGYGALVVNTIASENPLLRNLGVIFQVIILSYAYKQLKWTKLELGHPLFEKYRLAKIRSREYGSTKYHRYKLEVMNIGNGRAENVELKARSFKDVEDDYQRAESLKSYEDNLVKFHTTLGTSDILTTKKKVDPLGVVSCYFSVRDPSKISDITFELEWEDESTKIWLTDSDNWPKGLWKKRRLLKPKVAFYEVSSYAGSFWHSLKLKWRLRDIDKEIKLPRPFI